METGLRTTRSGYSCAARAAWSGDGSAAARNVIGKTTRVRDRDAYGGSASDLRELVGTLDGADGRPPKARHLLARLAGGTIANSVVSGYGRGNIPLGR